MRCVLAVERAIKVWRMHTMHRATAPSRASHCNSPALLARSRAPCHEPPPPRTSACRLSCSALNPSVAAWSLAKAFFSSSSCLANLFFMIIFAPAIFFSTSLILLAAAASSSSALPSWVRWCRREVGEVGEGGRWGGEARCCVVGAIQAMDTTKYSVSMNMYE